MFQKGHPGSRQRRGYWGRRAERKGDNERTIPNR